MYTHTLSTKVVAVLGAVAVSILGIAPQFALADTTVRVSENTSAGYNLDGWLFADSGGFWSPFAFTDTEASIGDGSLYIEPIGNDINGNADKFIGALFTVGQLVADTDSFSYDFLIESDADDSEQFYLNVYANFGESDPEDFYDCRYDIVPAAGSVTDWTTVTFDPSEAQAIVNTRGSSPYACPATPADMDDLSPGSTFRSFVLNVGDTTAVDQDVAGYYDNVVNTVAGDATTYDFEPVIPDPEVKQDCFDGGWEASGFKNQGQCVRFVETGKDSR